MFRKKWWVIIPMILVLTYLLGPRPESPDYDTALPVVPDNPESLVQYVQQQESEHRIKPDNEARIVWADDSIKQKTEYAIVYLHGFSASQAEGEPVHRAIAKKFGCNLYLSRLAEHGLDTTEQLVRLTAENYWESAKEAFAIAGQLGKKIIVMGTSTGGTLALKLAATYPSVYSIILLSPNIEIFDNTARILNNPWGLQIARLVTGSHYIFSEDTRPLYKKYWSYGYRVEGAVALEEMIETSMNAATFRKVTQPALLLYYYKDSIHQDSVVKVGSMQKMFAELGTEPAKKHEVAMPLTGNHVIGSYIKSADVEGVEREIEKFMTEILNMNVKLKR